MASYIIHIKMGQERSYDFKLNGYESGLVDNAIVWLAEKNPNGKYVSFAFISDLHQSKEGVVSDYYTGATCEPMLRLCGAVAQGCGLDAVFCGGDLSTGAELTGTAYMEMCQGVKDMFDEYIPVPYFTIDGNHDRNYPNASNITGNSTTIAEWRTFQRSFNRPKSLVLEYISDKPYIKDTSTGNDITANDDSLSFTVDIDKGSGNAVRFVCKSSYSGDTIDYQMGMMLGEKNCGDYTVIVLAHDTDNRQLGYLYNFITGEAHGYGAGSNQRHYPAMNGGSQGLGGAGVILGHLHQTSSELVATNNVNFNRVRVTKAFVKTNEITANNDNIGTYGTDNYGFSIFVVDTDNWKLYEYRMGKPYNQNQQQSSEASYDIVHNSNS